MFEIERKEVAALVANQEKAINLTGKLRDRYLQEGDADEVRRLDSVISDMESVLKSYRDIYNRRSI